MTKAELRRELRARRNELVASGAPIFPVPLEFEDRLTTPICISAYVSNGKEPDVLGWFSARSNSVKCTVALPYFAERSDEMTFRCWKPGDALFPSPFGFLQPDHYADCVAPNIVLTPLVGFDRSGTRLGQGAGHYDRAFQKWPNALRVGISWSVQEIPYIPKDAWDVPLDMIITECDVRHFSKSEVVPA
jgi:5-formyltetrahydrofolate cyclo-ligase